MSKERFIVVEKSLSSHCCFEATVVDTKDGKETYGDFWKTSVCECFDIEQAVKITKALNQTKGYEKKKGY